MGNSVPSDVRFAGLAGALAVSLGAQPAWTSPEPVQLEWHAPLECPQAVNVAEGVRQLLGEDQQFGSAGGNPPGNDTTFSGTITQLPEGEWILELKVTGPAGTRIRELTGGSCHELTEAGVAVIALALNETEAERSDSETTKAVPPSSKEPAPAPPRVAREADNTTKDRGVRRSNAPGAPSWGATAAMVVDFNTMPDSAVGAALGVNFSVGSVGLSAQALYLPPQYAALDERGAEISLAAASLSGCYWALSGTLAAGPCLKFEAGVLPAQGVSEQGTSGNGRWVAAIAGLGARWQLASSWGLLFGAELVLPLVRDEFMLGTDEVYRAPAVSGRMTLGPEVRFP